MSYRYGAWHGGPDPLAPPYDVRQALDEIGDSVLDGMSPREALTRFLQRGADGLRGLDDLRRRVRADQRAAPSPPRACRRAGAVCPLPRPQ